MMVALSPLPRTLKKIKLAMVGQQIKRIPPPLYLTHVKTGESKNPKPGNITKQ